MTFEASEVFFDPFYLTGDASANNEQRDFMIGHSLSARLLLVVYVEHREQMRIISVRITTRTERKLMNKSDEEFELRLRLRVIDLIANSHAFKPKASSMHLSLSAAVDA